ncbi:MAG: hypothetical protein JW953_12235 [Anaerolineae bacterium]|nr:hypothetical protein [Anaerolineae bacterium]
MNETEFKQQLEQERQARQQAEHLAEQHSLALQQAHQKIHQLTKRLEEVAMAHTTELMKAQERALEASTATSTFLANMSHELRTPLNTIIGYSEILLEEAQNLGQDDFVLDLQMIESAGKQLLALISDVFDLSKIEAGRMDLDLETFEIAKMIEDVVVAAQLLVTKNNNTLEVDFDDHVGVMRADLTKVRQILFNLLSNAAKFTEQGTIKLIIERRPAAAGNPSPGAMNHACQSPDEIIFRVIDTGIGITPDQMECIFEPFTQVDGSTTRKYGGTGLGLTICQHFCQMMGGRISVESEFGRGSTFTVYLPAEIVVAEPTLKIEQTE